MSNPKLLICNFARNKSQQRFSKFKMQNICSIFETIYAGEKFNMLERDEIITFLYLHIWRENYLIGMRVGGCAKTNHLIR